MAKFSQISSSTDKSRTNPALVLRIPKPNLQIVILGLIAVITIFQTFQLVRISSKASSASVKVVPAANIKATNSEPAGSGVNADVPESMVGGC